MRFKSDEWQLTWTRNLNLWHQVLSHEGYRRYSRLWGMNTLPSLFCITEKGTHTNIFFRKDAYQGYVDACMDLVSTAGKQKKFMGHAKRYAVGLRKAVAALEKDPSSKNWAGFMDAYAKFCIPLPMTGMVGRFGAEKLKIFLIRQGIAQEDISSYLGILTYPATHTPTVQSRIDLLEISIGKKSGQGPALARWMKKHQHIPVGFNDEPWTAEDAREQLASVEGIARRELGSIHATHKRMLTLRKRMMLNVSKDARTLADAIAMMTTLNEFRKNVISEASLRCRPCMSLIAKKAGGTGWKDVLYLLPRETQEIMDGKKIDMSKLKQERQIVGYFNKGAKETFASPEDIKEALALIYSPQEEVKGKSVVGMPANPGIVVGTARIVRSSKDFHKVSRKDILIAPMTSVDYVPVMEKAAAFVTNEGGLTSHASIVSREMNKPCVIGTKNATQVFKDGDRVEVDGYTGTVRRL